ncbi:MAG: UDP-glucose dehydrogenase family protein, partial [Candidatus Hadarchaeales archaeon]
GHRVVGTDFDKKTVDDLQRGDPPIYEPGLKELIKKHLGKTLNFEFDKGKALSNADFIFITFDTPVDEQDKPDLTPIINAAQEISKHVSEEVIVVVSSQVPVGTCDEIKKIISQNSQREIDVCYLPENLRLGQALESFLKPERLVLGVNSKKTFEKVNEIFAPLKCKVLEMSVRSAEMAKHALNAYLATCISFANEISDLCEAHGASAIDVVKAMKTDKRVGKFAPLAPGLGFSGGTLARDVQVLRALGAKAGCKTHILDAVVNVNEKRKHLVLNKLRKVFGDVLSLKVGILGLTYKPGTDTLRRSLALEVARELIASGMRVKAYDPKISGQINEVPELQVCSSMEEVADGCDVLVLMTEWPEFKDLSPEKLKKVMKRPIILDPKNFLDGEKLMKAGFEYYGVGV